MIRSSTRFTFIRDAHGRPVGCMAYRLDRESGTLEYEVSTHNPKDEYDRKTARFVAEGRLEKHPREVKFNPRLPPKLDVLLEGATLDLNDSPTVPNRLKKALRLRLAYLEMLRRRELDERRTDRSQLNYNPHSEF